MLWMLWPSLWDIQTSTCDVVLFLFAPRLASGHEVWWVVTVFVTPRYMWRLSRDNCHIVPAGYLAHLTWLPGPVSNWVWRPGPRCHNRDRPRIWCLITQLVHLNHPSGLSRAGWGWTWLFLLLLNWIELFYHRNYFYELWLGFDPLITIEPWLKLC